MKHPMDINTNTRIRWAGLRRLLRRANWHGTRVLDIGAGLGFFSLQFRDMGCDVVASDICQSSLDYIDACGGLRTLCLDAIKDTWPEGPFDLILLGEIMEHLDDPSPLLRQARARLAPGGRIFISTPALEGAWIHSDGKRLGHSDGSETHARDGFSKEVLFDLCRQAGFEVEGHSFCLFALSELFMQITKRAYMRKRKSYASQSDVLSILRTPGYRILSLVFPLLLAVFLAEEAIGRLLGLRGHGHLLLLALSENRGNLR